MSMAALIYAGGRGTRLGGAIKANIEVGGQRLLERVRAALTPHASLLLVAHGAIDPAALGLLPDEIAVPDFDPPEGGPLAGLAGALLWCAAQPEPPGLLLTAAVDTPYLPDDYAPRMRDALETGGAAAAVAASAGHPSPTTALFRVTAIVDLPRRMHDGTAPKSLHRLLSDLDAPRVDWPDRGRGDPFANVNGPADLAALEARSRSV